MVTFETVMEIKILHKQVAVYILAAQILPANNV